MIHFDHTLAGSL